MSRNHHARLVFVGWLFAAAWMLTGLSSDSAQAFHFPWDQGHDTFRPDDGDGDTDPGPDEPCQSGSPFEPASGNYLYFEQDLFLKGRGLDVQITRSYNSRDMRNGPFGKGWTFSYDMRIVETTDGATTYAVCRTGGGNRERFTRNEDGTYESPPNLPATLTRLADQGFQLEHRDLGKRVYDASGRLTAIVDRHNNRIAFAYDEAGFLVRISDAADRHVVLTKAANGKIAEIRDYAGRSFRYLYDQSGNLASVTDATGAKTQYTYDATGNLLRVSDPRGNTIAQVSYDSEQRVSSYTEEGETWTIQYSPAQKRTTKRDSSGNTWTFLYDDRGRILRRTDPNNNATIYTFDDSNISSITDANGNTIQYEYDRYGNPTAVVDAQGNRTIFAYDPRFNQVSAITDALGNVSRFDHNAAGDLIRTTDPLGQSVGFTYDEHGQLTSITDPAGNTTVFEPDVLGNLRKTIDPLGNVTSFTHDARGNVISATNAAGGTALMQYDENDQLKFAADAAGYTTHYTYDVNGNLLRVSDAAGNATAFTYDQHNRLTSITNPLGLQTTYAYDKKGNVVSSTDPNGQTTTMTYDAVGKLLTKQSPTNSIQYTYDRLGNVLRVAENDSVLEFVYDTLNRLVQARTLATAGQPATTISYSYDSVGNRLAMTDPLGGTTSYDYDAGRRVTRITDPFGQATGFTYDQLARRASMALANNVSNSFRFDAAGRLDQVRAASAVGALVSQQYTYDAVGNQLSRSTLTGQTSFAYDRLQRLTAAVRAPPLGADESYSYDQLGNRVLSHVSSTYTYDAANRLLNDGSFAYGYDANGNVASKTDLGTGEATRFTFDAEDQLIRIDFPDGGFATYRYDALGRRIEKNVNGQIRRFIYDDDAILVEYDGQSNVRARYTHGPAQDDVISVHVNGESFYYHRDVLGSTVALSDGSGSLVQSYAYETYGAVVSQTGTVPNSYLFTGREYDAESGLYYYRARYYDPASGRFLQRDPLGFLGGDVNLYAYVFGNPVNWVDPLGLTVSAPGFWEGLIPIWGSGRQALNDFQCGRWGWGLFNTALAVSDVFLVKSAVQAIGKGAWKLGSHSWRATRAWYGQSRGLAKGQHVHHWAITRNGPIGRHIPDAIKNQPWNLNPMPSPGAHTAVHGWGPNAYGPFGRWWHGTPGWAKNAEANAIGRGINGSRGDSDCNCN